MSAGQPPVDLTVCRHADVMTVLHDHQTFSNVVSTHPSVPNGMDPPEHTVYRQLIDPYFSPDRVAAFEPACRRVAAELVDDVCGRGGVDFMTMVALPFAARVQCAYLGWPTNLADQLIDWTHHNHEARRIGDRAASNAIAAQFTRIVTELIGARRRDASNEPVDLTESLMRARVHGHPLSQDAIVSILRNWTMGEVGTIAAAVGILTHVLVDDIDMQDQLRRHLVLLPPAIDEVLRRHGPLASNRRRVTRPVELGGRPLSTGDRLTIDWVSANRDPDVFPEPDRLRLDRHPGASLLYGAGIHVCPGAGLARLELRLLMEELLAATHVIEPIAGQPAVAALAPACGLSSLPVRLVRAVD